MVNVVVDVSKIIIGVGIAAGIVILASKADAEGAKVVLCAAAGEQVQNCRVMSVADTVRNDCRTV